MPRPDVLVLVLAGGQGSRLGPLTDHRAKPAVPFAAHCRLIDFPLSNCLHSAISDVWVLQQYQPASLNDHLSNGRPWDLDRTSGGLVVLPPYQGSEREGFTRGTADGLWRNASLIRQLAPAHVVLVSADAVYRMDYREVVREHVDSGAVLTMVTVPMDRSEAGRYGVVEADGGRVVRYAYKPEKPFSDLVSNEVFVFRTQPVLDLLDELAERAGDDGLADLGNSLLPALVDRGSVREHRHHGYWRDVGTIESYWSANLDFVSGDPPIVLDDPDWPIRTNGGLRAAAWLADDAEVVRSLVAGGATVEGRVRGSVVGPGARVEAGAVVESSVLLPGAVVCGGARVTRTILDDGAMVGRDAVVGGDGDIAVVGAGCVVPDKARVGTGEQVTDAD